jgi:glycosyltransferase involved in cell wall biosynthesis
MVSIVTPAYNNAEELRKLLESVRAKASDYPGLEVIVVDDCSGDDSVRNVAEDDRFNDFTRYIRMEWNAGPAAARNAGAKAAKNDLIIFMDSDCILNDDTLSRTMKRFKEDASVSILCGEYDLTPANPSIATRFKALMVWSWCPQGGSVTDFFTRVGAIKKSVFMETGGFDTNLKTASVEDYEFARRLMAKGYTIFHDPRINVRHHFPLFRDQIRLFFHRAFMWISVFKKYGKFDNSCTTPLQGISQACGFLSCLFFTASALNARFALLAFLFLALFIITNIRFFKIVYENDGANLTALSVLMSLVISCSVTLGAAWGVLYFYIYAPVKDMIGPKR